MEQVAVYQKVDGRLAVRDVIRTSRLGEYAALKALRDLSASGRVQPPPPGLPSGPIPRQPSGRSLAPGSPVQLYRTAIERIRAALGPEASGRLTGFVPAMPASQQPLFEGVKLGGTPDLERLFTNAQRVHQGAMARAVALEALDGLIAFALFEARNLLPAGQAAELAREVGRILKGK